jgi:two-component sensor histidine kinase
MPLEGAIGIIVQPTLQVTPFPLPRDVFITDELEKRRPKQPDYLTEKRALQELAGQIAGQPELMLARFVELAMEVTGATSAGLSLYEGHPAPGIFRWHHVHGALSAFDGATTPREFSPCGVTLDSSGPVLTRHAESFYNWISDAEIVVPEVLLVPLYIGGKEPLGTLWVVSDEEGHFDSGHAKACIELASFVGVALKVQRTENNLRTALEHQETLVHEMRHRLTNLFAIADSMIRSGSRGPGSKEEMARDVSGRLRALSHAQSLVLRGYEEKDESAVTDIGEIFGTVLGPYTSSAEGGAPRINMAGPAVPCGERTTSGLALVVNELATNAMKYGALSTEGGTVQLNWDLVDQRPQN